MHNMVCVSIKNVSRRKTSILPEKLKISMKNANFRNEANAARQKIRKRSFQAGPSLGIIAPPILFDT
jgi:hypothetical protein